MAVEGAVVEVVASIARMLSGYVVEFCFYSVGWLLVKSLSLGKYPDESFIRPVKNYSASFVFVSFVGFAFWVGIIILATEIAGVG